MFLIISTYILLYFSLVLRFKVNTILILVAMAFNIFFVFSYYYEINSAIGSSDSVYFIEKIKYYLNIDFYFLISHFWLYLDEFYSLLMSIILRPFGFDSTILIALNIIFYFLSISNFLSIIKPFCSEKSFEMIFLVLATNYSVNMFAPLILRESLIILLISFLLKYLIQKSYLRTLLISILLLILHAGFAVLFISISIYIFSKDTRINVRFLILLVLTILYFFINSLGLSIYKLNMSSIDGANLSTIKDQILGSAGFQLENSYRAEIQFDSFLEYFYYFPRYVFPFLFKPFLWEAEAISSPVNIYKTVNNFLLIFFTLSVKSFKLNVRLIFLLFFLTLTFFAASTSQYGQSLRHMNKFFYVFLTLLFLLKSNESEQKLNRTVITFLTWNVLFVCLSIFAFIT
jgi:hypothetical protein